MKSFDATDSHTDSHGVRAVEPTIVATHESLPPTQSIDISWLREAPAHSEMAPES